MQQLLKQLLSNKKYLVRLILPVLVMMMATSLFILPASATGVYQIPSLTADTWILDQGDVISRFNEGQISKTFKDLARETGNEARIVTIRRLDYGETPESFAKGLFSKWFPTAAEQANQVLLLVDTVTNGTTLISGDQVKSVLTDAIAQSVAEETLGTALRGGNKYNQGFLDVSDRLVAVLSGKPDPGPPAVIDTVKVEGTFTKAEETDQGNATAWVVGLLIAATVIPMATYYIYLVFQQPPSKESEE
ncbi:TPM domain-containing protein [Dolichospermum sp. ST_sed1]|nr:TPM domain-containing protein [Dolichospermum sp. ST_sed1]MDD1425179.1 TPM domain-containing protein [Dolichospermum sp. ST_sed9]MDD1433420.1 TPM domain-containing protein [Dolichospermum sp. ST_sed6]MDD1440804.1 TPM domain-containing protein [Dolichospermum sp. ST_sed3]MDD1445624.1 TPM domain-containing protein [Dolichospermum sp. ST_sed8]MDD1455232.1 TPM domain-containing protein [Dolichospermum sp. ST_sed7]MDD1459928.1 TPM domain-containing protein [Dolichospermum sp. ST_sed2]MDD146921